MMKTKNIHITINLVFAFLLIFTSSGMGMASSQAENLALIRIELLTPNAEDQFASMGISVHGQLYDKAGKTSWLAFVDRDQQLSLAAQAVSITILDGNTTGKDYFLVKLDTPNASSKLDSVGSVLAEVDNQAIIAVSNDQTKDFFNLGYEVKLINKQPILLLDNSRNLQLPTEINPDPTVQAMINQVTYNKVYNHEGGLSGEWPVMIGSENYTITTRHTSSVTASAMVTQYAYEQFGSLGLNVAYHTYNHPYYGTRRNVVAEQTGIGQPERVFLVTAHIDDMPSGSTAPGADDNASGSTGVFIAAEILSNYNFDCTLRYVLFTGEEQGLHGSYAYAQDAYNAGDDIEAVLNLDMIAYNSDIQPIVDLHTRFNNSSDLAIANTFVEVISAYNINLSPQIFQDNMGYSDHDSFWDFGFPAILAIEDDDDFTPYYHTVNDTINTLDLTYFTNFVKASVGTLAHLGCLTIPSGTITGYVTEADGITPIPEATVVASNVRSSSTIATTAIDGSYELFLPEDNYALQARHPDFVTQSITDVIVTEGITTSVDFALDTYELIYEADFTFQPESPKVGDTVTLTGTVTSLSGTLSIEYAWNFGDESGGIGEVITHTFPIIFTPQTYTVTLTTTNNGDDHPQSIEKAITVQPYQLFLPFIE